MAKEKMWVVECKVDAPGYEWRRILIRAEFDTEAKAKKRMREKIIAGRGPIFRSNFIYRIVKVTE